MNRRRSSLWIAVLGLLIFTVRLWLIQTHASPAPYWDQWSGEAEGVILPHREHRLTWSQLFAPHNEHRVVLTRLWVLTLYRLNRQWDPLLEQVANAALYSAAVVLALRLVRRRFGGRSMGLVLLLMAVLGCVPYAWENTLWGFQAQFYFLLIFTLAALDGLLLRRAGSRGWWLGAAGALLACLTSASGVLTGAVVAAIHALHWMRRRGAAREHLAGIGAALAAFVLFAALRVPSDNRLASRDLLQFVTALGRGLAFPWIDQPWLALPLQLPWLALAARCLFGRGLDQHRSRLALALGGWVVLQGAAIAYSRGVWGAPPSSRHLDLLAWGLLANLLAFSCINTAALRRSALAGGLLRAAAAVWMAAALIGFGALTLDRTLKELAERQQAGRKGVAICRAFLKSGDPAALAGASTTPLWMEWHLEKMLTSRRVREALPFELVVPPELQPVESPDQAFVTNGYYHTVGPWLNEDAIGSFSRQGDAARGRYVSEPIRVREPLIAIPVCGYVGRPGLSLRLVAEDGGRTVEVIPTGAPAESWQYAYVRNPGRTFRIEAEDQCGDMTGWFAFAAPRGVGVLSYVTRRILEYARTLAAAAGAAVFFLLIQPPLERLIPRRRGRHSEWSRCATR